MQFEVQRPPSIGTGSTFCPSDIVKLFFLALLLTGCGGNPSADLTVTSTRDHSRAQRCKACAASSGSASANPWLNASMIGRHWMFRNSDGSCTTWIDVLPVPQPSYYPQNSIDFHITKSAPQCYWGPGIDFAWVDFILSPADEGSYYSKGAVMHFPGTIPGWAPSVVYSIEVEPPVGAATPYMIVPPPSLAENQIIVYRTSYNRWDCYSENFNSFVFGPPVANVFWQTIFSGIKGEARADQREGLCGHELWDWTADIGLTRIAFPNDGDASCIANPASTTMDRVR